MDGFKEGQFVYLASGRKAEFVAPITNGALVRLGCWRGDENDGEEWFDELAQVAEVFASPPVELVAQEISALQERADALRGEIRGLQSRVNQIKKEKDALFKDYSKYAELRFLNEFIAGEFTHIVIKKYSGIEIKEKGEALTDDDGNKREFKLLTLFGRTKGDLQWRLNYYSDGSGSSENVWLCTSFEEAQDMAKKLAAQELATAIQAARENNRPHMLSNAIGMCRQWSVLIDPKVLEVYRNYQISVRKKYVEEAEKTLAEKKNALNEVLNEATP